MLRHSSAWGHTVPMLTERVERNVQTCGGRPYCCTLGDRIGPKSTAAYRLLQGHLQEQVDETWELGQWRKHTPNDHGDQENAAQENHKRPGYITMKDPIQYRHACKVRKPTERVHSTHRISPTTKLVQANAENLGAPITMVKVD